MAHESMSALVTITSHATNEEARRFDDEDVLLGLIVSLRGDQGWMIYLGNERTRSEDGGPELDAMSAGLRGAVEYALANGFDYIYFDKDADELQGVETYDW